MSDPSSEHGTCYLVGSGPGDLGLVTLRCRDLVESADVVVYDYLCPDAILRWARDGCELIYAGKKARDHAIPQDKLNDLLVEKTSEGKNVVRLKGGDPFVFGRGGEEAQALKEAGVKFEIVPGISSGIAGPAYAGIPVTHRSHNTQLTLFTGHEDPTKAESSLDYAQIAATPGTKVMFMGVERLDIITGELIKAGAKPTTPVALVRWATTGRQKTITGTLEDIAAIAKTAKFKAPAICVIGDVVGIREELNWFENRPLYGKRIVVTRTRTQAGALSKSLAELGADAYELPTIRIEPPVDLKGFGQLVMDAHTYVWLVFTSPNGVDAFFDMFFKLYNDVRSIGGVKIAAIGPGTAARIKKNRLSVDLLPEEFVAESLADALVEQGIDNHNILWVRAEEARDVLSQKLNDAQAILDEAIAYRTVPETEDVSGGMERFREEGADVITFTSSSTVECFLALDLPMPDDVLIASIGPITSQTLKDNGLPVHIEAAKHDIPGLVSAIREYFA